MEPRMPYLGRNFEKPLSYLKSAPSNSPCWKVSSKKSKFLNLEPKMPHFCILRLEFQNILVIFEIGTLKFVWLQNFAKKRKYKFRTKNVLFVYFWARIAKFCEETKIHKFGTKSAIFRYFWPKMLYLGIFGQYYCQIWNQRPKDAYLQILTKKQKCINLGPKIPCLSILD